MNRLPPWILTGLSVATVAVTLLVAVPVLRSDFGSVPGRGTAAPSRGAVAARVGDAVLYREDLALLNLEEGAVRDWHRDELLARTAAEEGLENPEISRIVQQRARQVYLRDTLLQRIAGSLDYPTEHDALAYMGQYPDQFLLERHYFHILLADSALADSIHGRLERGDSFQLTAQRVSLSQKAAIGGDLGFVTGGELFLSGMPREAAELEGLGPVYRTGDEWHILMVSESRPLENTSRVVSAVQSYLFNQRFEAAVESVVADAARRYDSEVNP